MRFVDSRPGLANTPRLSRWKGPAAGVERKVSTLGFASHVSARIAVACGRDTIRLLGKWCTKHAGVRSQMGRGMQVEADPDAQHRTNGGQNDIC